MGTCTFTRDTTLSEAARKVLTWPSVSWGDGKPPCSRVGRSYRIPRVAIEEFQRSLAVEKKVVDMEPEQEPELSVLFTTWVRDMERGARPCSPNANKTHRRLF